MTQNLKNVRDFYQSSGLYNRVIFKNNTSNSKNTIEQLKEKVLNLSKHYNKSENELVFSDGNIKSKIMIIGDAPGVTDEVEKKPFAGEAGDLLNKMLGAINLDRSNVYITNVVSYRLADNKKPESKDVDYFKPLLLEHIQIMSPEIILLLGTIALKTLFENTLPISKERGIWKHLKLGNKIIPCIPSFHPSFLLRQSQQKKLSWEDLKKLRDRINQDFSA